MMWMPGCVNRVKGAVYVRKEHFMFGYVNGGGIQEHDWLMLDTIKAGFYCSWSNLYYRPGPGRVIFRLDPKYLTGVYIDPYTGFFKVRSEPESFAKFYPIRVSELLPELFKHVD